MRPPVVIVIGAGIAGLVAAYELERLGHRVTVFEAEGRIGGRIWTHRFGRGSAAPAVELGAMRIPHHHQRTLKYIEHLDLGERVVEFATLLSDENAVLAADSGFVRAKDATERLCADFRRRLEGGGAVSGAGAGRAAGRGAGAERGRAGPYRDSTIAFGAWLTVVVEAIAPPDLREALQEDLRGQLLDLVEGIGPDPRLDGPDGRVDLHALFAAYPDIRGACSARLNSFLDDILLESSPALVRLRGGMDQLTERLARRLRAPIARGHEAVRIEVRQDDVLVHTRRAGVGSGVGGGVSVHRGDYAVCTLPFPALQRVELVGVDADKLDVLKEVVYCSATKVAVHCREPFWQRSGIRGGASFTGGAIRQTYYPTADHDRGYLRAPGGGSGAALLASYTIGAEADELGRMPARLRHRRVVAELGVVHPELLRPGMVLGAASAAWGQSPWAGGCTTRWGLDAAACERQRERAARPVHRLFFAGEHCSTMPAWIEGAVESAHQAVAELAAYQDAPRAAVAL